MRTYSRVLRILSAAVLFFFCWSFLPLWQVAAFAAEKKGQGAGNRFDKIGALRQKDPVAAGFSLRDSAGERFEKALESIREKVGKVEEKASKGEDDADERKAIKAKKVEIESLDVELRKDFAVTEKKLKDAKLPQEILDRHYKFVKHYEDNLKELKANLDGHEKAQKAQDKVKAREYLRKAKAHLEKTKPPKKHVPLDPNKLPFRSQKATKTREPRLRKEQFEKDFQPRRHHGTKTAFATDEHGFTLIKAVGRKDAQETQKFGHGLTWILDDFDLHSAIRNPKSAIGHKPILVAANGPLTGLLSPSPQPDTLTLPFSVPSEPAPEWLNRGNSVANEVLLSDSILNVESGILNLAQATSAPDLPTPADLAETPEVKFTPELRQIATLLEHNPVQLYEFVRNNFTYDPYYGSVKGSQSTLLLQNGNDFDQASILIALFRVSGIPARYVYGTVEIPIEKVMKWLGGITDPRTAGTVLATNGIPAKLIISGGTIKSVLHEHVWTEVYIPYANYRGLINDPTASKTWIPLDPSFKLIEPNPDAVDLADAQQFDIDGYLTNYLQSVKSSTPAKDYLKTTMDYVTTNMPGKRFYDLLVSNSIIDKVLGLLPETLSYPVKTIGAKFSSIPDSYSHRIALEFTDHNTSETVLNYIAPWTMLLHNRFTLSYAPATTTDEQTIANYGGIYSTPPYLIKVKPVLKVEGMTVAEGSPVVMAGDLTCKMNFIGPRGMVDSVVTNDLTVGATHAIGLGSGYTTGRIITYRTAKFEAAALAGESGDSILGEYLNLLALNYLQELDSSRKLISKSMKILDTDLTAELMVGVDLGVSRVFNIPRSTDVKGLIIDVDHDISTPVNMDGNQPKARRFQILVGMTGSALEHSMFEAIVGVEAVSTIKALQVASSQGISVHQIDASNISTKLPLLQLSSEVITDVQNAVNAGKVVTVSERNIQLNNWNGVGYIVLDPTTGAGAYMISSGASGGCLSWVTDALQYFIRVREMTPTQATEWILAHKKMIWFFAPVSGIINSGFETADRPNHEGVDFQVEIFTPVYAVADGTITRSEYSTTFGNVIYIDHGAGVQTRYAHNCKLYQDIYPNRTDMRVYQGDLIAYSGNTGRVTRNRQLLPDTFPRCVSQDGAHVHFEILLNGVHVDPESFSMQLR